MVIERIDSELCDGCGICVNSCSSDVIRMVENKKAIIKYPEDCTACYFCEDDCPQNAIYVSPAKASPIIEAWG